MPPDSNILARGDEWTELPTTIAQLPLGRSNLALWFADLDWSNSALAQSSLSFAASADHTTSSDTATLGAYRRVGNVAYRRVELTIFVLTQPHRLTGHDYETAEPQRRDWERHSQQYVTLEAKGLFELQPSSIYAILYQHWCGNLDIYRNLS